jgi:hypothetical protein
MSGRLPAGLETRWVRLRRSRHNRRRVPTDLSPERSGQRTGPRQMLSGPQVGDGACPV